MILSEYLQTRTGLQQGDSLACNLFNIFLVKLMRDAQFETKGTIYNKSI
jgi:hypothetical protein